MRGGTASSRRGAGDVTNRVIPRNPKYASVEATLHTGPTIRRAGAPMSSSTVASVRSAALIYDRMPGKVLADLLFCSTDSRDLSSSGGPLDSESAFIGGPGSGSAPSGPRVVVVSAEERGPAAEEARNFVLIDVREEEEYHRVHLDGAVLVPAVRLRQDRYPIQLLQCRHRPERQVIVCDWDEKEATDVATKLSLTGLYPNVSILAGGLQRVCAGIASAAAHGAIADTSAARRAVSSRASVLTTPGGESKSERPALAAFLLGADVPACIRAAAKECLSPALAATGVAALDGVPLPSRPGSTRRSDDMGESVRGSVRGGDGGGGYAPTGSIRFATGGSPVRLAGTAAPGTFGSSSRFLGAGRPDAKLGDPEHRGY